ncbi:MAG: AMP-binding protein [Bacteroidia bacterium]|jgi:acetyl-CoA synthetase|nr:AMP-binding protein [Bacteroidia bacterium]GIV22840.1 MAG: AMP-dependent synthetase [Bacteroidia bacterium]
MSGFPPSAQVERWLSQSNKLTPEVRDFSLHIRAYEEAFQKTATPPFAPLWYPCESAEILLESFLKRSAPPSLATTHLFTALGELLEEPSFVPYWQEYKDKLHLYTILHRWSVEKRADFWRYVVEKRIEVAFRRSPARILSFPTADIAQPMWLSGAEWNVVELIFRHPPEKVALVYQQEEGEPQEYSYAQLEAHVREVAGALRALGVSAGERIAICMPLRPEAVFLYLAAIFLGASAATIPDSLSGEEIATRLRIAAPKVLFIQDGLYREGKFIPLYERLQAYGLPQTFVIAGRGPLQARLRNNAASWESFLVESQSLSTPTYGPSDRDIGVLFSSGTTAEPKAIPWTQLTALKAITDAHFYHDVHPTDTIAWPTNLGWMMGPWLLFAGLAHGATVALYEGAPTTEGFCRFVETHKVSILGVVPSLVRRWIESGAWDSADWTGIRLFSSTGEASNPWHMWRLMAKAGYKPIIEYCGGTEIGGGYITSTLLHPNAPSQFSAPALGLDFILLREDGQPAAEGELFLVPPSIGLSQKLLNADHEKVYYQGTPSVGEGWVGASGASVPREYAGVPVRLRRHGDYMRQLESGNWISGGRADDAMNLGGIKVSSTEIERVVAQLPGVGEVAAIAIPPSEGGPDQLILFLVVQEGAPTDTTYWLSLVAKAVREKLSPLFHVHEVVIVPELPRTASNKIMRRVLRAQYLAQKQAAQ